MKRIYLAQVNNRYGENVYLPYSAGMLWAYAASHADVAESWQLGGFLYLKEPVERAADKIEDPDVLGLSCYIWNWQWSLALAREVKRRWPSCLVLAGGVQVPEKSPEALSHNCLDLAIYGEGEGAFVDLLRELAKPAPELSSVGSLTWRDGDRVLVNTRREPVDTERLRSPYLDNTFSLILGDGWRWQVAQETNRGCPYACTFCAWGAAALSKVRKIPTNRVLEEIEWFAAHKSPYIDNCDANFGILPRDAAIVDALVETKLRTGFPERFRTSWAKNSNDKVFSMARKLHTADMLKAVTLSMQSMDEGVLEVVKRKNIRYDDLSQLLQRYDDEGIPTYTELIMGLPGETYNSFVSGIERVLEAGQHDGLFCYPCLLLPNTEMSAPEYVERHGICTVTMRAMLTHGTPQPNAVHELQDIVVATATMTHEEWRRCYHLSWLVQVFHVLGLAQQIARSLAPAIGYREFYESLLDWAERNPEGCIGAEYVALRGLLDRALAGGSWDCVDERFGEISWPSEEFSFLRLVCDHAAVFTELGFFLQHLGVPEPDAARLVDLQRHALSVPEPGKEVEYAREAVWYGRKGSGGTKKKRTPRRLEVVAQ